MDLRAGAGGLFLVISMVLPQAAAAAGPAVSAPNGKLEFDAGALNIPSSFAGRVAGTVTLPVGYSFGIQADVSAASLGGFNGAAALHVFTRDPERYLIGGTLGAVWKPGATVVALGPEGELYLDRWTLEAWAGAARVHPSSGADRTGVFAMGDIAYYPHDNLRLSAGLSVLDGFAALHLGGEYLFNPDAVPMALTGDARLGQDGSILATVGLKFYFGGPPKSLIERHRQDDPWDRGASLFTAVGNFKATATSTPPSGPTSTNPPPKDPPVTDPTPADPRPTDPPPKDPPVTNPTPVDPPVTDPTPTDPPATDTTVDDPPVTDPTPTDPPVTDPTQTDPTETDPPCPDPITEYYDRTAKTCLPNH